MRRLSITLNSDQVALLMKTSKKITHLIICQDCHTRIPDNVEYIYFKNKYFCKSCYGKVMESIELTNIDPTKIKIVTNNLDI